MGESASAEAPALSPRPRRHWIEVAALWFGFILFLATAVMTVLLTMDARRQQEWVSHTLEVRTVSAVLLSGLFDAEAGQRGFLLTGEEEYFERFIAARASVRTSMSKLDALTPDNTQQHDRVAKLKPLVAARLANIEESIATFRGGAQDRAIVAMVRSGEGPRLMSEIRDVLNDIDQTELRLLDDRRAGADRALTYQLTAILATLFSAMVLIAISLNARGRALRNVHRTNVLLEERVRERTEALEARTKRIETLIQDVSHRIGNALSLVTGFLDLQARSSKSDEVKAALAAARQRVFSIASAQRRMRIAMDSDTVEASTFFGALIDDFRASLPDERIAIDARIDTGSLPSQDAAAYGVILNEWLANAVKHAFHPGEAGNIEVRFTREGAVNLISVCDDGHGGANADEDDHGLGHVLVRSLVSSLQAEMRATPRSSDPDRPGTCWTVRAPSR